MKTNVIVSDFDGTLTSRDTMFDIIRFQRGRRGLFLLLVRLLPWLMLMKAGLYSHHRAKERLLALCFRGVSREAFAAFAQRFADARRTALLRQKLLALLRQAQRKGDTVIVVTASPEEWVRRFVPEFQVVGTRMAFTDEGFTGRFATPNCYGAEKVRRLTQALPQLATARDTFHVTAYGDSRGDRELLAFADEPHLLKH